MERVETAGLMKEAARRVDSHWNQNKKKRGMIADDPVKD
jgi:hypothetical protein